MPELIKRFICSSGTAKTVSELYNDESLKLYSIISSVLSLAWSFTSYEAIQQKGALGFDINPVGRISLLLSTILQVLLMLILTCDISPNYKVFFRSLDELF